METKNLAELYDLPNVEWSTIVAGISGDITQAPGTGGPNRHTFWLATIDADGRPHVTGVGAQFHDGAFWFETGESTRKGRNVARDPRVTLSVAADDFDLVVEGEAHAVTDPEVVAEMAAIWAAGGWPCEPDESGTKLTAEYSAPSAGAPPWTVYRVAITAATALSVTGEGGATRWTF